MAEAGTGSFGPFMTISWHQPSHCASCFRTACVGKTGLQEVLEDGLQQSTPSRELRDPSRTQFSALNTSTVGGLTRKHRRLWLGGEANTWGFYLALKVPITCTRWAAPSTGAKVNLVSSHIPLPCLLENVFLLFIFGHAFECPQCLHKGQGPIIPN